MEKTIENKIAKTITYVDKHQNAVWPGFHLSNMPILSLVDDDAFKPTFAHLYAYNFSPVNPDWQRVTINGNPVYYMDHDAYKLSGADEENEESSCLDPGEKCPQN